MPRASKTVQPKLRDAEVSRARVFDAAAEEFAARGFDGAKVDRIAERAGVNKAMLYYHYKDKADLYRAVVGDMFASTAAAMKEMRARGGSPEEQLSAFIDVIALEGQRRPHFPAMWLRELADAGQHLGDGNFNDIFGILSTLMAILKDGQDAGRFRPAAPFMVQMGIVGPLFMFLATSPMRERLRKKMPSAPPEVPREMVIDYVKAMTMRAVSVNDANGNAAARRGARAGSVKKR